MSLNTLLKPPPGRIAAGGILTGTLLLTVMRTVRLPNDWAEGHWLITYDAGFVRRGLAGTLVNLTGLYRSVDLAEQTIAAVSILFFGLLCLLLIGIGLRIWQRSGYSVWALLMGVLFLASPFIVMSAHLMGYFDHVFETGTILVIILLLRRRYYAVTIVQILLVLVHESYLVVGFPVVVLTGIFMLVKEKNRPQPAPVFALIAPVLTGMLVSLYQATLDKAMLYQTVLTRLEAFPFVERNRPVLVAEAYTESLWNYLTHPWVKFGVYITDLNFYLLVFPVLIFALHFMAAVFKQALRPWQWIFIVLIMLSPLSMHLIAWDFSRIWMYPIFHGLLVVWVCAELYPPEAVPGSMPVAALFAVTFGIHALSQVPLMDDLSDSLTPERAFYLFVPVSLLALGSARHWLWMPFRLSQLFAHIKIRGRHIGNAG